MVVGRGQIVSEQDLVMVAKVIGVAKSVNHLPQDAEVAVDGYVVTLSGKATRYTASEEQLQVLLNEVVYVLNRLNINHSVLPRNRVLHEGVKILIKRSVNMRTPTTLELKCLLEEHRGVTKGRGN